MWPPGWPARAWCSDTGIITSGTTAFAALALLVAGGEVLWGFALTLLVGVVSGTYSTIFIAPAVAVPFRSAMSAGS